MDPSEQIQRDIAAARADLRGRRDAATAEYDERLQQLESLTASLERGDVSARVAQDRVRQLIGERAGVARGARAGRTSVGMRLPNQAAGAGQVAVRSGPTPAQATAELEKAQSQADARIVSLLLRAPEGRERDELRLELSLLRQVRASIDRQLNDLPRDSVLIASLVEFGEEAQAILSDLSEGGARRVQRLLDFDRQLLGQLVALGGTVAGLKEQIKGARQLVGSGDASLGKALEDALSAFDRLQTELRQRLPGAASLLDDLLA